jgi:hypothetical protein
MYWHDYERAHSAAERLAGRAAQRLGNELEKLVSQLPKGVAPIAAMELIADILVDRHPQLVIWLYEHLQREDVQARLPLAAKVCSLEHSGLADSPLRPDFN